MKTIYVTALQDTFNYEVNFPNDSNNIILIAPNGFGKTALLSLLRSCLELDLRKIESHRFGTFTIVFDDGSSWHFEKRNMLGKQSDDYFPEESPKYNHWMKRRRPYPSVKIRFFNTNGSEITAEDTSLEKIDPRLLLRAAERIIPSYEFSYEISREINRGNISLAVESILRHYPDFFENKEIQTYLKRYQPELIISKEPRVNCVFIETQRLITSTKNSSADNSGGTTQEEVLRQAQQLATLLQRTYSNYASISQSLDRSFPNRLIDRAKVAAHDDPMKLRQDLNDIEKKRERLTEAGILVEQSEQLVPPADEYLPRVADALQIYVTDSRAKLATFDSIYPKISVFRDLLSKKLRPKELLINREKGAEVRRGEKKVALEGLSSGEKHEFIMLFKLIFETPEQSVVLIDEPEISLHVLWQLEFMPDLIKIQQANSFQSIIATHSPQIFQSYGHLIVDLADQVSL